MKKRPLAGKTRKKPKKARPKTEKITDRNEVVS